MLAFGHCPVVLSVRVPMPSSQCWWALPILFRLYRTRHECEQHGAEYRKKTELARQLLELLCSWTEERRIELAVDSAYCNDTVTRGLPERVVLLGAMRLDAVLTALPPAHTHHRKGGRPRRGGELLPKPEALARDPSQPWSRGSALLYGRRQTVQYKTLDGQWYRACGVRLLRIVIVRTVSGSIPFRVFFCSDATLSVAQVLQGYSYRWAIEVFSREAKQLLNADFTWLGQRGGNGTVAAFWGIQTVIAHAGLGHKGSTRPQRFPTEDSASGRECGKISAGSGIERARKNAGPRQRIWFSRTTGGESLKKLLLDP